MHFNNSLSLFVASHRSLKKLLLPFLPGVVAMKISDKLQIAIDPTDLRGPSFHLARSYRNPAQGLGGYEPEQRMLVRESLEKRGGSPVFLDVGANIGLFSFPLASEMSQVKIFGFEPHPRNARCYGASIALNAVSNVALIESALGDSTGQITFYLDESDSGGHSTRKDNLWNNKGSTVELRVPLTTLDRFVEEKALDRIDVVKVDVQGAEDSVLRGGLVSLRKFLPDLLIEAQHETVAMENAIIDAVREISPSYKFRTMEDPTFRELPELIQISKDRFQKKNLFADYFFSVRN